MPVFTTHLLGKGEPGKAVKMTKRELEIIAPIADAPSNKEISQQLHTATCTVKSHVHTIPEKLAVHSRLLIAMYTHGEPTP